MVTELIPADVAAAIRRTAWTQAMRRTYAEVPGFYTACACEYGTSGNCETGHCGDCVRGEPLRRPETVIVSRAHTGAAFLPAPYAHETDVSATGPKYERIAHVWLTDRVCTWTCPHRCHQIGHVERDQLSIFDALERV
ncbi:MAG TPA: DUF6248 family natural product biosynthesis protein [Streptosporangiaceae bacterium]|jgi:hypothetical protein